MSDINELDELTDEVDAPEGMTELGDDDPVTRESSTGLTGDFEFDRTVTGPPVEIASIGRARAMVPIHDSVFQETMEIAQTLRNAYGDKDEAIARYAEDLLSSLQVIYLEFSNHPGMTLQRLIQGANDPAKQRRMIAEARATLNAVERRLGLEPISHTPGASLG